MFHFGHTPFIQLSVHSCKNRSFKLINLMNLLGINHRVIKKGMTLQIDF